MAEVSKKVNVQYRACSLASNEKVPGSCFERLMKALDKPCETEKVRDHHRHRRISWRDDRAIVLNRCDEFPNWCFGEVALFAPGQAVEIVEELETSSLLNFMQRALKKGEHPVKGVVYFLLCENHLLSIQAPNTPTTLVREFLENFLRHHGVLNGALGLEALVEMSDEAAPDITEMKFSYGTEVAAGPDASPPSHQEDTPVEDTGVAKRRAGGKRATDTSVVRKILVAAGWSPTSIDELQKEAGSGGMVIADLDVYLLEGRSKRKISRAGAAELIANHPYDNIEMRNKHGRVEGTLSRLAYDEGRVRMVGAFMDPDDVRRVLVEAYNSFVSNSRIVGKKLISDG